MTIKKLDILGIPVSPVNMHELNAEISELIYADGKSFVLSGNIHGINLATELPWLKKFYNQADLVRVDGAGVTLGARILGHVIPSRITWADWGMPLAQHIASKGHTLFLLGGPGDSAEKTAERFRKQSPDIRILGFHHGYFDKQGKGNELMVQKINNLSPDILIVGLGMPLQERWILDNCQELNVKVILTCGAAFEYLSGKIKRCPEWMGKAGLEWLYRFGQNPRRMAKRYLYGNTVFILRVLMKRLQSIR